MTRELNVTINMTDVGNMITDTELEEIIQEGIYSLTGDNRVSVCVETVKPESE